MLERDPERLYEFARSIGLSVQRDDTPQKVLTRMLQLAVRVYNVPEL